MTPYIVLQVKSTAKPIYFKFAVNLPQTIIGSEQSKKMPTAAPTGIRLHRGITRLKNHPPTR